MIRYIGSWLQEKLDETSSLVKAFFLGALDGIMTFWMFLGAIVWCALAIGVIFKKGDEESND